MKNGFTLIELLVAITIIGIISMFAIVSFGNSQQKARDAQRKNDLSQLATALEHYYNDNKKYVPDAGSFATAIAPYMQRGTIPNDPSTGLSYYYNSLDGGDSYILYAKLENCNDPQIIGSCDDYNYSITSSNTTTVVFSALPPPPPTSTPTSTPTSSPVPTSTPTPTPTPGGPPSFRASSMGEGGEISKPVGVVQNDLLLAKIVGWTDNSGLVITPPPGWTLIRTLDSPIFAGPWYLRTATYRKIASSSEPAFYTWSMEGASVAGAILAYSNVNTSSPIHIESGQGTGASGRTTSHTTPSVTTTIPNTKLVTFFSVVTRWDGVTQAALTTPSDMTERANTGNVFMRVAASDMSQNTSGPTGNKTAISNLEGVGTAEIISIVPVLVPE